MNNRNSNDKQPVKTKKKKAPQTPVPLSLYTQFDRQEAALLRAAKQAENYVYLELKLVDFHHADFVVCLRINTPLWTVKRCIQERHAHVERLQLFRAPADKKNEIMDFSLTLDQIGLMGGPKEANTRGVLYYNFKPIKGDAIVLREPQLILEYNEAKEREARSVLEEMGLMSLPSVLNNNDYNANTIRPNTLRSGGSSSSLSPQLSGMNSSLQIPSLSTQQSSASTIQSSNKSTYTSSSVFAPLSGLK